MAKTQHVPRAPGNDQRRPVLGTGADKVTTAATSVAQDSLPGIDRAIAGAAPWDRSRFEAAVEMWARSGFPFLIETVVESTGMELDHPNRLGALTQSLARRGVIHRVGYTRASKPSRAGAVVAVWAGGDGR